MAIIAMEGFDGYSDITEFNSITQWAWGRPTYTSFQTGRTGGKCVYYTGAAAFFTNNYFYFSSYEATAILGLAVKAGSLASDFTLCRLNAWGPTFFDVQVVNSYLNFTVGDNVQGTHGPIYPDTWYYIEIKVTHSDTGTYVARVNEQQVLDASGDYRSFQETIGFKSFTTHYNNVHNVSIDDLYILDDTGSTFNDFLGDIRIDTIHPSEAGNYSQFTPSAGNNYECVDETQYDDSDYVESANVGDKDTYGYDDVPTELDDSGIYALRMVSFPKRTVPADNVKLKHLVRQSGSDYAQTEQSLPETFYMLEDYVEKDPSDNGDWTKTRINSAEFGVEVG